MNDGCRMERNREARRSKAWTSHCGKHCNNCWVEKAPSTVRRHVAFLTWVFVEIGFPVASLHVSSCNSVAAADIVSKTPKKEDMGAEPPSWEQLCFQLEPSTSRSIPSYP